MLKGQENLIKLILLLTIAFGGYLMVAWASYSPLDNSWSVASSITQTVINKTGALGAWLIDLLFAFFGKMAFVVPLVLSFSAAYLLILRLVNSVTWKSIGQWLASFALLMLGLSALASVLLPDSPYYLSGGFVGGWFVNLLGNGWGQFAVLFLGMIFTAVGFYFCSGQVLVQLGTRLYHWILTGKDDEKLSEEPVQNVEESHSAISATTSEKPKFVSELENIQHSIEEIEEQVESVVANEQLTDISHFPRPNIYGLNSHNDEPKEQEQSLAQAKVAMPPSQVAENHLTDLSRFNTESTQSPLPTIRVEEAPTAGQNIFAREMVNNENEILSDLARERPVMPTVRLTTEQEAVQAVENTPNFASFDDIQPIATEVPKAEPKIEISLPKESMVKPVAETIPAEPEIQRTPTVHIPPLQNDENARMEMLRDVALEEEKETNKIPTVALNAEPAEKESKPSYPNGYGSSLIHPLLQKSTVKTAKPTTPLPTLDLLDLHSEEKKQISELEVREISQRIEQELANFRVKATVEDVLVGPVVTRYEIQPATGTPAAKISRLENDLARTLMLGKIRITEVVTGKPYMGIEAPNRHRETVWLRDVLDSEAFCNSRFILPMALGKDISGKPVVVDMAKMPHLLVAGQTGGGKSVGVNTMILSLLFKRTPDQLRFIMIDPKVVELSIYNDIPHLLTPVVTDMKKAENALRWAVEEMERRYLLLSSLSVRNIEGYNEKIRQADEEYGMPIPNPLWRPGDTMDPLPPPLEKMSYIVLVVDEFADLMMSAGKQVEDHIMRIAQKARAVGIHLILATQRPSTDVITGVIKANIPSRIAFTVASQIDSRTILDAGGAESLLGRGDMLYSASGSDEILRVHGAFMTDEEVERIADNWRARGKPDYINSITESREETSEGGERNSGDLDDLFDEVAQYMVESGVTSISGIQRRFQLGFNRAARIIDQLEAQGIVSSPDSRGKREVLAR